MHTLNLIRFEAAEEGGYGGGGGDPFGPSPHLASEQPNEYVPEPVQQQQPQPEPEPVPEQEYIVAEPTWDAEREQQFEQMSEFFGSMQEALQQAEQERLQAEEQARFQLGGELPEFDPLDPQNVSQHVLAQAAPWFQGIAQQQQQILSQLEQLAPFAVQAAEQQGEQTANSVFDRLEKPVEEGGQGMQPINRDLALTFASLAQANGYEGEDALMQGALEANRIAAQIRAEGAQETLDHQERVRGLRQEPQATGPVAAPGDQELSPTQSRAAGRRPFRQQAVTSLEAIRARRNEAQ